MKSEKSPILLGLTALSSRLYLLVQDVGLHSSSFYLIDTTSLY